MLWRRLAGWAVPEKLFPRHLTQGDRPLLVLTYPLPLTAGEYDHFVARWRKSRRP